VKKTFSEHNRHATEKRVDIVIDPGAQELLPDEICTVHSPSGLWIVEEGRETILRAYPEHVESYIEAVRASGIRVGGVTVTEEPRRDYADMARKYFRPVRVEDIVIRAPWNRKRKGVTYITIEPGMAFGTGRHESTRLMMKMMRDVDFSGKRVLDLGCGSGLLSLYARLKGARSVYAVDNDLDAILSAQKNMLLNEVSGIELVCSGLEDVRGRYDVVLANLDIRTFALYSTHIKELWKRRDGILIISGVIGRERKDALGLFLPCEPVTEVRKNSWRGYLFER
jgi:ribosomal protein L11 methyltransferase